MQQYTIRGGNGFVRELFCHRQEAIAAWKRIGGNTKLYAVKDGCEFEVFVPNNKPPANFKGNPFAGKQFSALFKTEECKVEKIEEHLPVIPEAELPSPEEPNTDESHISVHRRPMRSWFAYPSY